MSEYCVIGRHGFIGSALAARLGNVTSNPTPETKVVFHFGSPRHPMFEQNSDFYMQRNFSEFLALLPYCREHGIQFVYPSSALVYEKETQFSRFKKTLESLAACYSTRTLGLRIFPSYGKAENATVISQWCRAMLNGERPIVYGDGNQSRDFIYIDDVVDQILSAVADSRFSSKVIDIGTGVRTTFNEIVKLINEGLGTSIEPKYVARPSSYSEGIVCASPLPTKVSVGTGIRKILNI